MWALLKNAEGRRLLVNLDQTFALEENEKGGAQAVSIAGAAVPLAESFDWIMVELMGEKPADKR